MPSDPYYVGPSIKEILDAERRYLMDEPNPAPLYARNNVNEQIEEARREEREKAARRCAEKLEEAQKTHERSAREHVDVCEDGAECHINIEKLHIASLFEILAAEIRREFGLEEEGI